MITIKVTGTEKFIKNIDPIRQAISTEIPKANRKMALRMKQLIKEKLVGPYSGATPGHNTPLHLARRTHIQKKKDGYLIWMEPYMTGGHDLASILEYGARPHIIEGKFGVINHPGMKGKKYFSKSAAQVRREMREEMAKVVKKAVRR